MKFFIDLNEIYLNKLRKVVERANSFSLIDNRDELINKSLELKKKVSEKFKNEDFDNLDRKSKSKVITKLSEFVPEGFSLVKSAVKLSIGFDIFDSQLLAGVALFNSTIGEIATGEGKTLIATLPLYMYSLLGRGANLVTVNDYLVKLGGEWCGLIFDTLGISTGIVTSSASYVFKRNKLDFEDLHLNKMNGNNLVTCSKQEAYGADITYCNNTEIGFDYLRDNMQIDLSSSVLRDFFFCIVDEADSILIDESRTPLIISLPTNSNTNEYIVAKNIVEHLDNESDYIVEQKERKVILTDQGTEKIEKMLNISNLWNDFHLVHLIDNALSAKELYIDGKEYMIKDGQIMIVDEFTGRVLDGRRFSEGIHQAIEAKEGVSIRSEDRTAASISYQNLYKLFPILSGMTGTAYTEAEEFEKIYGLDVVRLPTNRKVIREDKKDVVFKNEKSKLDAVVNEIKERHKKGQPVLVGTTSIDKSEQLSELLKSHGIDHNVLNAKNHAKEAEIIAMAGQKKSVTISTNMAGRGTDISLGEGVKDLGGLFVLGTERHEARRIDNQLRGRAGRQGDPGESQFFISLEDNIVKRFGGETIVKLLDTFKIDENMPINLSMISNRIEKVQKSVEGYYFDMRKDVVEYDDVINTQREILYKRRKYILSTFAYNQNEDDAIKAERKTYITSKVYESLRRQIKDSANDYIGMVNNSKSLIPTVIPLEELNILFSSSNSSFDEWIELMLHQQNEDKFFENIKLLIDEAYDYLVALIPYEVLVFKFRVEILNVISVLWMEYIDTIERIRQDTAFASTRQKDPLIEFKNQVYFAFEQFITNLEDSFSRIVLKPNVPTLQVNNPEQQNQNQLSQNKLSQNVLVMEDSNGKKKSKRDPNSECFCGSKMKYSQCGQKNTKEHRLNLSKKH